MVYVSSLSVHKLIEIFQVPNQTTSHAALLTRLHESKTNCNIQTREMPFEGIAGDPRCSVGARAAENIIFRVKKHSIIHLKTCHLVRR